MGMVLVSGLSSILGIIFTKEEYVRSSSNGPSVKDDHFIRVSTDKNDEYVRDESKGLSVNYDSSISWLWAWQPVCV